MKNLVERGNSLQEDQGNGDWFELFLRFPPPPPLKSEHAPAV